MTNACKCENGSDLLNVLSFDVEDWGDLAPRLFALTPEPGADLVVRQCEAILRILAEANVHATFFVLGRTAAYCPGLVARLVAAGHEIATHGYEHVPLTRLTTAQFAEDLRRAIGELTDVVGAPILGHRAPAFSVPPDRCEEFFDVLAEFGVLYDSSVVPMKCPRYGISGFSLAPTEVIASNGQRIMEFPLSLVRWAGRFWPVAGGGFWRLLPKGVLQRAVHRLHRDHRPLISYLHNCQFDPDFLKIRSAPGWRPKLRFWTFQQNLGHKSIPEKMILLLQRYRFGTFRELLSQYETYERE